MPELAEVSNKTDKDLEKSATENLFYSKESHEVLTESVRQLKKRPKHIL